MNTVIDNNCWLSYCGGLRNPKREIKEGDIEKALKWYQDNTGQEANLIRLHPRMMPIIGLLPEGIVVIQNGGTAAWSIDLATNLPVIQKEEKSSVTLLSDYEDSIEIHNPVESRVEKASDLPVEPIPVILQSEQEGDFNEAITDIRELDFTRKEVHEQLVLFDFPIDIVSPNQKPGKTKTIKKSSILSGIPGYPDKEQQFQRKFCESENIRSL
jgi:hypothetical protein